jgi:type IX secretion system PorP/SprF family membrane protein
VVLGGSLYMRKNLLLLFVIGYASVSAQYLPYSSQPFQFSSAFNPAFSGIENYSDLKLSYRYQWAGFGSDAPKFINLAFNTRVKQPLDIMYNSLRTSNPALVKIPPGKRSIHGLSANLYQSSIGVVQAIGGGVNYSVNYPLINELRISVGAGAYVENKKFDISKVSVRDPDTDEFYKQLLNGSTSQTDLNVRAGFLLYTPKSYFGVSYLPLFYKAISSTDLAADKAFYKGTAQAGILVPVNPDLILKPSIVALWLLSDEVTYDVSVKAYIQKKVWTGLTYRSIQSGVGMIGFNFNSKFSVSYSYELSLGRFQQFSNGSHELVLGMKIKNIKKYDQYVW